MPRLTLFLYLAAAVIVSPSQPATGQTAPPTAPASEGSKPQVLFERSTDPAAPTAKPVLPPPEAAAVRATDAMRLAPVFTDYDLEVHLDPAEASLAVEARLTLRNGGTEPLPALPLQLSSTLHIERVSLAGTRLRLAQEQIVSDADHTGRLEETLVALPQPLPPGDALTLSVAYSGKVEPAATRLDQLQTPSAIAAGSEWDRISGEFTGLRGFGDLVWYPVCSIPALLGDGARLFAEIGRQRLRNQDAKIAIHVIDEFTETAPATAVIAGHVITLGPPQVAPTPSFPGVLRFDLPQTRLGFRPPSLFLANGQPIGDKADLVRVYSRSDHAAAAQDYLSAATLAEPLLTRWLGPHPGRQLTVIELPVEGAQPSEVGDAVLVSLIAAEPQQIAALLSRELAHAWFHSPRVWLDEGVSAFMGNLFVEQTQGRQAALEQLAASRSALALAEPASPATSMGQSLIDASDAIYYRAKALYVLAMLRDLTGDKPLASALTAYDAAADTQPEYFQKLIEQTSGKDLKWFFNAWVYHDLGLPDLSIANVYASRAGAGEVKGDQWLVSVDIANDGYAEAEVPVTVHSATTAIAERVRIAGRSKVTRRLLIAGEPTSVEVNDGTVPEVQASLHQRLLH